MSTRRIFEYLVVLVALTLVAVYLFMNGGEWRKLVQDVLPNLIAGLVAFGSMYFLFTRRNISIASLTGESELRSEFRKYIIPAGRSLEQAMDRAAEAYSQISQDAGLSPENVASLTYYYQTMVKDIFHAYATLMESWVFLSADTDVLNPIVKAKAYIQRASDGRSAVLERSRFATGTSGAVFIAALKVLDIDLGSALHDLEDAMYIPKLTARTSTPRQTLQQTVRATPASGV